MHEQTYENRVLRCERRLTSYMPALAVAIVDALGVRRDVGVNAAYVADLLRDLKKSGRAETVFPPDLGSMGRSMRVYRTFATPVEVDGVVATLESTEKTYMYQKTQRIVLCRGRLQGTPTEAVVRAPVSTRTAPPVAPPVEADRAESLEIRVAALEEILMVGGLADTLRRDLELSRDFRLSTGKALNRISERLRFDPFDPGTTEPRRPAEPEPDVPQYEHDPDDPYDEHNAE